MIADGVNWLGSSDGGRGAAQRMLLEEGQRVEGICALLVSSGLCAVSVHVPGHSQADARVRVRSCAFSNCAHLAEPGCAVREGWARHPWCARAFCENQSVRALFDGKLVPRCPPCTEKLGGIHQRQTSSVQRPPAEAWQHAQRLLVLLVRRVLCARPRDPCFLCVASSGLLAPNAEPRAYAAGSWSWRSCARGIGQ